jgi:hypothetical protein
LARSDDSDFVGADAPKCTLRVLKSLNSLGLRCRGWEALEVGTGWDTMGSLLLSQFETKRTYTHLQPEWLAVLNPLLAPSDPQEDRGARPPSDR